MSWIHFIWLTICGANYPSDLLAKTIWVFKKPYVEGFFVYLHFPQFLIGILCDGVYETVTWIIAVMLPPMAIFFPLFTLLEDFGFLPRIAFNLDKCYARTNMSGKQCLTQCMGLGCNCVGVVGARIMPNETQRTVAILTNSLMPCNGRFALLIAMSTIFIGGSMAVQVSGVIPMLCVLFLYLSFGCCYLVRFILSYKNNIQKNDNEIFCTGASGIPQTGNCKDADNLACKPNCQNCRQSFIGISSDRRTGLAYGKYTN